MKIIIVIILLLIPNFISTPVDQLTKDITSLVEERKLKGIQLQVTINKQIAYNLNLGQKNEAKQLIDNSTMFRIASVSKSFASVALLQLVEQKKLKLDQSLSSIFGYKIQNPFFPGVDITVQMILSHQSTLIECDPYYSNFLSAIGSATTGTQIPNIRQILLKGGKFYNDCLYSSKHKPGTYFQYVNLNFGIAGTIVQILSNQRYDQYQRDHILKYLSQGQQQMATFNPATIKNAKNLGIIYIGNNGVWQPNYDYYPSGQINQRNLTGYKIGSNGVIYGPQGSLRASASHLTNYAITLANQGMTKSKYQLLTPQSVIQLTKPRYHYHGSEGGSANDFHIYGLGLFTTTYRKNDFIINHEVVKGHTGSAYNLISGIHFWKNFTFTYIINGALNGYKYGTGTIYEYQRLTIHKSVQKFINSQQNQQKDINLSIE